MKKIVPILILAVIILNACASNKKTGCPSNGRNVGAEKLVTDDPKAQKEAKKAGKFKFDKMFNE
ncbi:hypothetical protein ACI6Q2_05695 [Chitinophagaceae bacterium LWZ2-11]